ncbi:MAG: hypothetical protein HY321_13285, partial [Armatimonadetes bacterium]|nr:hypothetical protein [Armatimonadota bacterium]
SAAPDAWRWAEAPAGRWIALRAAGEERPGVCATVPIALTPAGREGLLLDVRCARSGRDRGGVGVELLNAAGALIAGRRARVSRGDGWVRVVWERGKDLWDLDTPAIRLRFTIEPGARLYGFRFAD